MPSAQADDFEQKPINDKGKSAEIKKQPKENQGGRKSPKKSNSAESHKDEVTRRLVLEERHSLSL